MLSFPWAWIRRATSRGGGGGEREGEEERDGGQKQLEVLEEAGEGGAWGVSALSQVQSALKKPETKPG